MGESIADEALSQEGADTPESLPEIKNMAMRFLARREYSRLELQQKLSATHSSQACVDLALDQIKASGYQSDERYAELIVRSRINQLCGAFKIEMELKAKGVAASIISLTIESFSVDWFALAKQARGKRYGELIPLDAKSLAKQMRYLRNKGFSQEHIHYAFGDE